jgi:hypothetical protein
MRPITDAGIARRVTVAIDREGDSERARMLATAAPNGSATTNGTRPLLEDGDRVVHDGTVYRLAVAVTASRPATHYQVTINDLAYDGVTTEPGAERVRFADLPAVDRQQFRAVGLGDGNPLGIGTTFRYTDAEHERSVLVPEPEYSVVVWGPDRRARFAVDGTRGVTSRTYRYTVSRVADADGYGRRLRREYGFELTGLSAAERDVVEAATETDDRFTVPPTATPTEGIRSLSERFRPQMSPLSVREPDREHSGQVSGSYVVRYDGTVYWTQLYADESAFGTTVSEAGSPRSG